MMALVGVRDVEAKEGTTHSSECERRERGQHDQETGREGPGAVGLRVGRAVSKSRLTEPSPGKTHMRTRPSRLLLDP